MKFKKKNYIELFLFLRRGIKSIGQTELIDILMRSGLPILIES